MRKTYRPIAVALLGASTISLVGCGGGSSSSQAAGDSKEQTVQQTGDTTSLTDPKFQPQIIESDNAHPARQVVGVFLDSLRRGDETTMNSVLTTLAKTEVKKTSYAIQPVGTPQGKFDLGRLVFPYEDRNVTLVECRWSEPATPTEPELKMDIVCEVHQEADGWKIAGMAVNIEGEQEPLVIDFEDGQRLEQLMRMANGQPPAGQPVSQPNNNQAGQIALPGQMPNAQFPNNQFPNNQLPNNNQLAPGQLAPGQLPQNQPQFGQLPQLPGSGTAPAQVPNLSAPPQLPGQLPSSNPQLATPPGGNVLR
ncbi:MAG: hypothetical protein U0930_11675 [Pirellulales bacterium]